MLRGPGAAAVDARTHLIRARLALGARIGRRPRNAAPAGDEGHENGGDVEWCPSAPAVMSYEGAGPAVNEAVQAVHEVDFARCIAVGRAVLDADRDRPRPGSASILRGHARVVAEARHAL